MDKESQTTVTMLLEELRAGDSSAFPRLLPFVYQDLKERAHAQRRRWEGDQTLNTTALINEAYLKLATAAKPDWENRAHFLAVAAKAMRRILIDYARIRRAQKRGGDRVQVTLDELNLDPGPDLSSERAEALLALDRSLERLSARNERQSQIVECRFFGGMTIPETAEALGISPATVERDWAMAKVWLYRDMQRALGG